MGGLLVLASAILYLIHYAIFRDPHHIYIYLLGDIAFLPIEILFVTLIIDRVLSQREKRSRLDKLNMVIGAFFSETGIQLLGYLSEFDITRKQIGECLAPEANWKREDFISAQKSVEKYECMIGRDDKLLQEMREFLLSNREFLLTLLENPALMEHETFTDLLWAVFHLTEELKYRYILEDLPDIDHEHLNGDIARAYNLLLREWLSYMEHLKENYPYLYSLALRMNPLDPDASPVFK
jgi:hypothetical protein